MKREQPLNWPPVIRYTRAPWYVRARDVLITIVAWAVIVYLVWDGLVLVFDFFRYPIFQLTKTAPPDWVRMWDSLDFFLVIAAGHMAWIVLWGFIRRRRLGRAARVTPPPPLALEEHAATFGLQPSEIEQWRQMKTAVVEFDSHSRITGILQSDGLPLGTAADPSDGARTALHSPPPDQGTL